MTTDLSKKQLTTILSALDDAPRSPANKGEALRAIGRSATRVGLTTDDVLAAAPGLLDGRMSPLDFRVALHDLGGGASPATDAPQAAPEAQEGDAAGQEPQLPTEPVQAAVVPAAAKRKAKTQAAKAKAPKPAKTAPADKPTQDDAPKLVSAWPFGSLRQLSARSSAWIAGFSSSESNSRRPPIGSGIRPRRAGRRVRL